jgi:thiosulfate/3-mercaptopyruvate sulfurtransferase
MPGSVLFDWKKDINEPLNRNILTRQAYEELIQREGVNDDTTLALYGDFNNWFAAFAFWVFKYYGYNDIKLINGDRKKWLIEDRSITTEIPQYHKGNFRAAAHVDNSIRAFLSYLRPYVPGLENRGGSNNIVER